MSGTDDVGDDSSQLFDSASSDDDSSDPEEHLRSLYDSAPLPKKKHSSWQAAQPSAPTKPGWSRYSAELPFLHKRLSLSPPKLSRALRTSSEAAMESPRTLFPPKTVRRTVSNHPYRTVCCLVYVLFQLTCGAAFPDRSPLHAIVTNSTLFLECFCVFLLKFLKKRDLICVL